MFTQALLAWIGIVAAGDVQCDVHPAPPPPAAIGWMQEQEVRYDASSFDGYGHWPPFGLIPTAARSRVLIPHTHGAWVVSQQERGALSAASSRVFIVCGQTPGITCPPDAKNFRPVADGDINEAGSRIDLCGPDIGYTAWSVTGKNQLLYQDASTNGQDCSVASTGDYAVAVFDEGSNQGTWVYRFDGAGKPSKQSLGSGNRWAAAGDGWIVVGNASLSAVTAYSVASGGAPQQKWTLNLGAENAVAGAVARIGDHVYLAVRQRDAVALYQLGNARPSRPVWTWSGVPFELAGVSLTAAGNGQALVALAQAASNDPDSDCSWGTEPIAQVVDLGKASSHDLACSAYWHNRLQIAYSRLGGVACVGSWCVNSLGSVVETFELSTTGTRTPPCTAN